MITQKCRYCGRIFIKNSPAQRICKDEECQWKRKRADIYRYRDKIRATHGLQKKIRGGQDNGRNKND